MTLQFHDILQISLFEHVLQTKAVICFTSKAECPLLFFTSFFQTLFKKTATTMQLQHIAMTDDRSNVAAQLAMPFLGMRMVYWLNNISTLSADEKKKWITYLNQYEGPQVLCCFVQEADAALFAKHVNVIPLPASLSEQQYKALVNFFEHKISIKMERFIQRLLVAYPTSITLDKACCIIPQSMMAGGSLENYEKEWLGTIVASEHSLFLLSQYFFAKNKNAFFALWVQVYSTYPEVFWTTYWSEQWWQAYHVIMAIKGGTQPALARKIGYRLPFSFFRTDWRLIDPQLFVTLHDALYSIDHGLKNGASAYGLEALFVQFFAVKTKRPAL